MEGGGVLGVEEDGVEEVEEVREETGEVEGVGDVDASVDEDEDGDGDGEVVGSGLESARNAAVVWGDILPCLNSFNRSTNSVKPWS